MIINRYLILFVVFLCVSFCEIYAQDSVYCLDGTILKCKIQKVSASFISYNDFGAATNQKKFLLKEKIAKISFENGTEEIYKVTKTLETTQSEQVSAVNYDIIATTDGDKLKVYVKEVDEISITYQRADNQGVDKIDIKKVLGIKYNNGYEEFYAVPQKLKEDIIAQKQNDTTNVSTNSVLSRDIVKLRNGTELRGKVVEISETNLQFLSSDSSEGVISAVTLSEILKITYSNGYEEIFTEEVKTAHQDLALVSNPEVKKEVANEIEASKSIADKKTVIIDTKPQQVEKIPEPNIKDFNEIPAEELQTLERFSVLADAVKDPLKVRYLDFLSTSPKFKLWPSELSDMKNVVFLNMGGNQIKEFPLEVFNLPELQYLYLDEQEIGNFKIKDMTALKKSNITCISLKKNKLSKIPSSLLELPRLKELQASNNKIADISIEGTFDAKNSKLRVIDLQKNKFTAIPPELNSAPYISEINLAENDINIIDPTFTGYSNVKILKLNDNPIKSIDKSFYKMSSLENINLNKTLITSLPDSISKLTKLRSLVLPGSFHKFPTDFGALKLLTELHINNNSLVTDRNGKVSDFNGFPLVILGCDRLKILDITGVKLNSIPSEISQLKKLENLYLSDCNISECPAELFSLPLLKVLDLSKNQIKSISKSVNAQWAPLETLNLKNSPLDISSILLLKRYLPQAQIEYFDSDFGLNFTSTALPSNLTSAFEKLFVATDTNDPDAYYQLGNFFKDNNDFGLALKAFRTVSDNPNFAGTGKSVECMLAIAEIYDDIDNKKPYSSPYKRKRYFNYNDYTNTVANDKSYTMYVAISNIAPKDEYALQAKKKACARASIITTEIADNLSKIYDINKSEIERIMASSGDKLMGYGMASGDSSLSLIGGLGSVFSETPVAAKDDKQENLKKENKKIKAEISRLKDKAAELLTR